LDKWLCCLFGYQQPEGLLKKDVFGCDCWVGTELTAPVGAFFHLLYCVLSRLVKGRVCSTISVCMVGGLNTGAGESVKGCIMGI
jgi:hypothetical protein